MTKNIGLLLLITLLFTGCQRQYAFVQPAKVDVFIQKQRFDSLKPATQIQATNLNAEKLMLETNTEIPEIEIELETSLFENKQPERLVSITKYSKQESIKPKVLQRGILSADLAKSNGLHQVEKQPVKKKKKKTFRRWNNMIPSGLIFLGIAILLSLINLTGLALLFGVASIIFLFFGIKKLLRKRRRREIFR